MRPSRPVLRGEGDPSLLRDRAAPPRRTGNDPWTDLVTAGSWPALVKAALLGTERTGRATAGGGSAQVATLVDAVAGDADRSPERVLLAAAATVATARRAGRQPEHPAAEPPAPAPLIDRPAAGAQAASTLGALLGGTWRQLLPEWLETCGERGLRVPTVWLPEVLEAATASRALRPPVLAALGERGRWLAAQRAEWRWAIGASAGEVPGEPLDAWAEGTGAERRALLAAVRAVDPPLGRSLVLSTWRADRADDRAAFVELLGTRLSMADEPFLEETALRDRARDVRRSAAATLAQLPDSRLAARMRERATAHVVLGDGTAKAAVRMPDDLPPEWEADGVDRQGRRGVGERAWWLAQVAAAAPLACWGAAGPAVAAVSRAEHGGAVVRGWVLAATRQRRADWAVALLAAPAGALPDDSGVPLLRVLDPAARAAWLAAALDGAPRHGAAPHLALVGEVPRPWPAALVRAVAGRAAAAAMAGGLGAHTARPALLLLAERADPATLDRLTDDLAQAMQADRRLEAELRRPLALTQLRKDILAELA